MSNSVGGPKKSSRRLNHPNRRKPVAQPDGYAEQSAYPFLFSPFPLESVEFAQANPAKSLFLEPRRKPGLSDSRSNPYNPLMLRILRHRRLVFTLLAVLVGCTQVRLDLRQPVPVRAGGMELIAVSGAAYQRGMQIGQAYAEELRLLVPMALLIEDQLEAEEMAQGEPSREDALILAQAQWSAEARQEMLGLAHGSGVKETDILRYNTLPAIRPVWRTRQVKGAASGPVLVEKTYTLAPRPALETVWHPILLCRTEVVPASTPASGPATVTRHLEARQVGMVWPVWTVRRDGTLVVGPLPVWWPEFSAADAPPGPGLVVTLNADRQQVRVQLRGKDPGGTINLPLSKPLMEPDPAHPSENKRP